MMVLQSGHYTATGGSVHSRILSILIIGLLAFLTACNDDDDSSADTAAPTVEIHFPGYYGLTDGDTVLVTGSASDANTITRVRVAGVDATSTDGFATWRATVLLEPGDNLLEVETTDELSNIDTAAATLTVGTTGNYLQDATGIALDAANNRALVIDAALLAVVAVDLTTGVRTILSGPTYPDTNNPFGYPVGIAVDDANHRALVIDSISNAVVAVDLATGARKILSEGMLGDTNSVFNAPAGIAVDTANRRALVAYRFNEQAVIAVSLDTGERTVLSSNTIPDANNPFGFLDSITIDAVNNRALVTSSLSYRSGSRTVMAVDLTTGTRSVLSSDTTPDSNNPFLLSPGAITLDTANYRALVVVGTTLVAVDLATGARSILVDETIDNTNNGSNSSFPKGITVDAVSGRALLVGSELDSVLVVDLLNGTRSILSDSKTLDANNPFESPEGIALDIANDRALVSDRGLRALVSVNLNTGSRTILSGAGVPDSKTPFFFPAGLALEDSGRALVVDKGLGALLAVDTDSGERTVLSSITIPDENDPITPLGAIALDSTNARALLTVSAATHSLLAVDLNTGERQVQSGNGIPDGNSYFWSLEGVALDSERNRSLVVDKDTRTVFALDLTTGARTILSSINSPDDIDSFAYPGAITLDASNDRALVIDSLKYLDSLKQIVSVKLNTGARSVLSGAGIPDDNNMFLDPSEITVDVPNERALVVDRKLKAIVAVELTSGDRVIISK